MAKIFSVVTLVVALVATYLGFETQKRVETLQTKGKDTYDTLQTTKNKLKRTEEKLKATEEELAQTKAELEKTKETLRTTEEKLAATEKELGDTKTKLAAAEKELADAKAALEKTVPGGKIENLLQQLAAMQAETAELKAKVTVLEKEKAELTTMVEGLTAQVKGLEAEKAVLTKKVLKYEKEVMDEGIHGQVLAVNAGWGFCVISIGDKQGVAANRTLVVSRNGQAIGKIKINTVEKSQSVADILRNTFVTGTDIQPGDSVIYLKGADKPRTEAPQGPGGGPGQAPALPPGPVLPELPGR